jgi:hypothetical protein
MNRPDRVQMIELLKAVDAMNERAQSRWLFSGFNFARATRIDLAYLSVELGSRGFGIAPASPDHARARPLMLAVIRWTLSMILIDQQGHHGKAQDAIIASMNFPRKEIMNVLGRQFCLDGLTFNEALDISSMFASLGYTFVALTEQVMVGVGLTWDDVFQHFVGRPLAQATIFTPQEQP